MFVTYFHKIRQQQVHLDSNVELLEAFDVYQDSRRLPRNIAKKITDRRQKKQLLSQKALEACKHFISADNANTVLLSPGCADRYPRLQLVFVRPRMGPRRPDVARPHLLLAGPRGARITKRHLPAPRIRTGTARTLSHFLRAFRVQYPIYF